MKRSSGSLLSLFILIFLSLSSGSYGVNLPPDNPWLADSAYPVSHHNAGQTDSTWVDGPSIGKKLERSDVQTVPVLWSSAPTYKKIGSDTVVIASNPLGLIKIKVNDREFKRISDIPYPEREEVHQEGSYEKINQAMASIDAARKAGSDWRVLLNSWLMYWRLNINMRTMPSGAYSVIDKDGYHYTNYDHHYLVKSFDGNQAEQPLLPVKSANIVSQLLPEDADRFETILGISMTWDGYLVAAATGGIMVVDRELQVKDYVVFPGEWVENSVAVDEGNGIYVVTSQKLHKFVWTGEKISRNKADGAWSSPYDVRPEGEARSMGAASHGSGTTPSLMGFGDDEDKLVIISDASPEGARVVAFWRDKIPDDFQQKPGTASRRIADQIPLDISRLTIEPSPAISGYGVLVINSTYPEPSPLPMDLLSNAFTSGVTRPAPKGIQKYQWLPDENRFVSRWSMEDIDNTDWMPPAVSTSNGLVYIANRVDDVYEYRAADWETGELKAIWSFPDNSLLWNNWGGITVLLENGDLLLGGFFAVKRYRVGGLR